MNIGKVIIENKKNINMMVIYANAEFQFKIRSKGKLNNNFTGRVLYNNLFLYITLKLELNSSVIRLSNITFRLQNSHRWVT